MYGYINKQRTEKNNTCVFTDRLNIYKAISQEVPFRKIIAECGLCLEVGCSIFAGGACRQFAVAQETQMVDEGRAYKRR